MRLSAFASLALVAALPAPNAPLPQSPPAIIAAVDRTEQELHHAIEGWDTTRALSRDVVLLALYQQRLIRHVAEDGALARTVIRLRPTLRDDVTARADLTRLSLLSPRPAGPPHIGPAAPAARLLAWYHEAQRRFHIRWQTLAAVNFVESAFGRVRNVSGAGARGPMQFEPASWKVYGLGGNVDDPHDAILGAANYLAADGGVHDERAALFHYNPSRLYVDAIRRYAARMSRDRYAFYEYYNWQVFFRTASGYRRVTGPR